MKKLDTSAVTSTIRMPLKEGTLEFLQLAYQEGIAAAIIAQIGASYSIAKVYVLYGLQTSVAGGSTVYTAGAVFYNNEFFQCGGGSITTPSGGNVLLLNAITAQFTTNADPVTFTDSVARNVHNMRTVVLGSGASGTGTLSGDAHSDYGNAIFLPIINIAATPSVGTGWTTSSSTQLIVEKHNFSEVYIRGSVETVSGSPSTDIFTLPAGYRPSQSVVKQCCAFSTGAGTSKTVNIIVDHASGVVSYLDASQIPATGGVVLFLDFGFLY